MHMSVFLFPIRRNLTTTGILYNALSPTAIKQ